MAREPRSARRVVEVDKSIGRKPHRGSVRFHVFGQVFACLIGAVFVAEALVVERSPARDDDRMWLATGADGVGTLSLAVSSQAALIATTDTSGRVSLWDEASESIVRDIDVKDYAMSVAFTSDGRLLAIGGLVSGITLWPVEHGTTEQAEVIPLQRVKAMAFSPDGTCLAAASANSGQVVIWDRARRCEKLILTCRSPILSLAFSPDGRYLASGEQADVGTVSLWDVETGCGTVCGERVVWPRSISRFLAGRGCACDGGDVRQRHPALGHAIRRVVPCDRGASAWYERGRFFVGWWSAGGCRQRWDGSSLERGNGGTVCRARWTRDPAQSSGVFTRWSKFVRGRIDG